MLTVPNNKKKNENFLYSKGYFELFGSFLIGEKEQKTNFRPKDVVVFESFINNIDADYNNEDVILTGWIYKLYTTEFIKVNISQNGRGTNCNQDTAKYTGKLCYNPTSGICSIKRIK